MSYKGKKISSLIIIVMSSLRTPLHDHQYCYCLLLAHTTDTHSSFLYYLAVNDVTKQKDLSKFYRHFFHEQTSPEKATPTRDEQRAPADHRRDHHKERRRSSERRRSTEEEERVKEKSPDPKREESSEEEPLEGGESNHDTEIVQERPSSASAAVSDLPATTETVTLEERRRVVSAKRTNEETFQSAKERYLARKRAKLTNPSS